ncbi:MAG: serine/threonine-protein kinase [Acidobacteriota bacterium]
MSFARSPRALVPRAPSAGTKPIGLPSDLIAQSARRLRIQALLYAFAFFTSGIVPMFLFPDERVHFFSNPGLWAPSIVSIVLALAVAAATMSPRLSPALLMRLGLWFEIVGSIGIATAQYLDPSTYAVQPPWAGLSWVAVWVLGFNAIVPNPPRVALAAALVSVSTVPLTVAAVLLSMANPIPITAPQFFFALVLPYLVVVVIAYVSARVIYNLGTEITRARELGSYRLIEPLGRGGMGEVWRAEHRLLARAAAVKLMRPEVLGRVELDRRAEFHARFEREAQTTASLRSPHTVELYDFGVADDGTLYYVMELLDGFDLGTLVDRFGPVPAERAIYLLRQMCHSLAEAHGEDLIHRDIKPANVYTCRYGRDVDFVKVLDFGLVKSLAAEHTTQLDLTREHAVGGTPAFMAPEQALGDRALDGRADIYATGCVGYWLLTGQQVFKGASTMELLMHHIQTKPIRPSARTEMPIPEELDALILMCLEKNRDDRPASAEDLHARLARIGSAPSWDEQRRMTWWQTNAGATVRR